MGKYLYAVVPESEVDTIPDREGVDDASMNTISEGPLAAVVSDFSGQKVRPKRRHLRAHHETIRELDDPGPALPVSFGTVASNPGQLRQFLRQNRDRFERQLDRIEGHVEMGLTVEWKVDDIFEYMVERSPELRERRDQYYSGGREPTRDEKLELGQLFESILDDERQRHVDEIAGALESTYPHLRRAECKEETGVASLDVLVPDGDVEDFEDRIVEIAEDFSDDYLFAINGPLPPYSFVDIEFESV